MRVGSSILTIALALALIAALAVPTTYVTAEQVVTIRAGASSINVTVNVPANVSSALLAVAVMKVSTGSEELMRFYAAYVVGGDVVEVNSTELPHGQYVVKVIIWNDLLTALSTSGRAWQPLMYYVANVTLPST